MKLRHYIEHIKECHSYLPGFSITCGLYGCPRNFSSFSSFRSHVYEIHGSDPLVTNQPAFYPAVEMLTHVCEDENETDPLEPVQDDEMESESEWTIPNKDQGTGYKHLQC